jgi:hypothetical protein
MSSVEDGVIPRTVGLVCAKLAAVPKHRYHLLLSICGETAAPLCLTIDLGHM